MAKMKCKNFIVKGFSLIEMLVVISIIGILCSIALLYYGNLKKSADLAWTKAEMTEIVKIMKTAKSSDGYYHQFIYSMGYRPKGSVFASVGTDAPATICCSQYPDPGTSPCSKNHKSGFLYYNCGNSPLEVATDNIEICGGTGYSNTCDKKSSSLSALSTSDFTHCSVSPTNWCDCNQFTVGAITRDDIELTINQIGTLCVQN